MVTAAVRMNAGARRWCRVTRRAEPTERRRYQTRVTRADIGRLWSFGGASHRYSERRLLDAGRGNVLMDIRLKSAPSSLDWWHRQIASGVPGA
jgi:hypothetical protein